MNDPLCFRWEGESLLPLTPRWAKQCDKVLVVGQVYRMAPVEERSAISHRHYFCAVNEAFDNLPEALGQRFKNADQLRKHALITAGYSTTQTYVCGSRAEAERTAASIGAFAASTSTYVIIKITRNIVEVFTAQSQDMRSMDRKTFQKSKDDTLNVIAAMIGVTPEQLTAARAA